MSTKVAAGSIFCGTEHLIDDEVDQSVLTLGARIEDPATFAQRLNSLLTAFAKEESAGTGEYDADQEAAD